MDKLNLGWALSLDRLIELTEREPKRVVRPVSPRMIIRPVLGAKRPTQKRRLRR